MTDTRNYNVDGATLTVTTVLYPAKIEVKMMLDVTVCDAAEPPHSNHNLISYLRLGAQWAPRNSEWWSKLHRSTVVCKTGSQAARIRDRALVKLADAVSAAKLDRARRKAEMAVAIA